MSIEFERLAKALNDFKVNDLMQKLSDLSENCLAKIELEVASEELTELEKALVCVALYWFYSDVSEQNGYCKNASATKKIKTLSRGEYNFKDGRGGEVGAFWWALAPYKIWNTTSDADTRKGFSRKDKDANCPSGDGWSAWCAAFLH